MRIIFLKASQITVAVILLLSFAVAYLFIKPDSSAVSTDAEKHFNVYLTFDDGPSENTEKILDILDSYGIKATFFVTGKQTDYAEGIYKRLATDGHSVGNHTYSHEYNQVYKSPQAFWDEVDKLDKLFYGYTGKHLELLRFPGGSDNTVSNRYCKNIMQTLVKQAREKNITYFDWNVTSKDAEAITQNKQLIINATLSEAKGKENAIVLFHDNSTKYTTVEALPTIIDEFIKRGAVFKTLSKDSPTVQFLK